MQMSLISKMRTLTLLATGFLLFALPQPLLAQAETVIYEEKSLALRWVAVAVFTTISVAIAMKNPKRQHQD